MKHSTGLQEIVADVSAVELEFLEYKSNGIWDYPKKHDKEIIQAKYLFYGPVVPSKIVHGKGYKFQEDTTAGEYYKQLKKYDIYK